MRNIVLFCSAGMSTSMLVTKMKEANAKQGKDFEIAAYSLSELEVYGKDADVIMLGPQVRFALPRVKEMYPDIPSTVIDMRSYGMMDGTGVLASAEKMIG